MAITPMKRIEVWAYGEDSERIVRLLLRQRCVDVDRLIPGDAALPGEGFVPASDESETVRALERELSSISVALNALYPYSTRKKSLVRRKIRADVLDFADSQTGALTSKAVSSICAAVTTSEAVAKERSDLLASERLMTAWSAFDLPLGFSGTQEVSLVLGTLPRSVKNAEIEDKLGDLSVAFRPVSETESGRYMSLCCVRSDEQAALRRLSQLGFVRAEFPADTGTAAERLSAIAARRARLDAEEAGALKVLKDSAPLIDDIETLHDAVSTRLRMAEYRSRMVGTGSCVLLRGWVPEDRCDRVAEALGSLDCAYGFSDPSDGDKVPVSLKNNFFARNFEWVVAMYSLPAYGTYDPTFVMGVWFCILFSMMFADAGYGLLMALGGFLIPKLLHFDDSLKRAFNMFGYCGLASIVTGILFGGYFGDLPLSLCRFFDPEGVYPESLAILIDPVIDPTAFMIAGLAVGFLHLVSGQFIKFCIVWKKSRLDAICDYAFYWIIYAGIILLILRPEIGKYVAVAGCALVVLTAGRKEKNIFMKLPKGLLGLYGLVNFGSDIISYSRVLAIALSGTVLAQVFNILATMSPSPVFRILATPLILLLGHVLNLALSALSAFVHTSRLQYVEFFGKFYVDGGRPFAPMLPASRFTEPV
jgi:V/A-type H+-transporting ATPase subunit I